MTNRISEKTIEDIFSTDKSILAEILDYSSSDLSLISRQKEVASGKLDLLCMYNDNLVLIELKVVPFDFKIIKQINGYYEDLKILQNQNKLVNVPIQKVILVTSCSQANIRQCNQEGIRVCLYNPGLRKYFSVISFSIHQKLAERLWKCGHRCALAHISTGTTTAAMA